MPLNNAFYRMQVNLHGSLCITAVYCYGHKKRNLAQSLRKYAILTLRSKKISGEGRPFLRPFPPVRRGAPPPHTSPYLAPTAPRLGSRLRRSTLAPNFNS